MIYKAFKKNHGNNEGSTIVIVIIGIAFIAMLGTVIMALSLTNYQMKVMERNSKSTFYSAETVLDQISAGLQDEISLALNRAYTEVMQRYSMEDQETREYNFKYNYITTLREALRTEGSDQKYDISVLKGYVANELLAMAALDDSQGDLYAYDNGIVLKGLYIKFNKGDYYSEIKTDIRLKIPEFSFTESSQLPDIFNYCIIANKSLEGSNTGENNYFYGNIYGGTEGIKISDTSKWTISNAERVSTNSSISIDGANARLIINQGIALWANELIINSSKLDIKGKAYVRDDLTIEGDGSKAVISGEYYGYGNSTKKADESSSIVINGSNSVLDMSSIKSLLLSGHSFIGTSSAKDEAGESAINVLMGESLSIKSNQVAYLVPDECINQYQKNPLTGAEYLALKELRDSDSTLKEVSINKPIANLGDKKLSDYGISQGNQSEVMNDVGILKVFSNSSGETLVYYYVVLYETKANEYFKDYVSNSTGKERLKRYVENYVNEITINDETSRTNLSGSLTKVEASGAVSFEQDTKRADEAILANLHAEEAGYLSIFNALGCKLLTSYDNLRESEKNKTVYDNLINTDNINSYLASRNSKELTSSNGDLKALIVNGDYTLSNTDSKLRLILATGDVNVNCSFQGLIISGGKVTIGTASNATISSNRSDLTKVLQIPIDESNPLGENIIEHFFIDGSSYVLEGTNVNPIPLKNDIIDLSTLILYENWIKQ